MTTTAELLSRVRLHGAVPRHVAIIMDGNGRWARERLMPRPFGHRSGMKAVREVVEGAIEAGIEVLSLFAFSQENWQRPSTEVSALMSLLEEYIAARGGRARGARACACAMLGDLERLTPPRGRRGRPGDVADGAQRQADVQPLHLVRQPRRDPAGDAVDRGRRRRRPPGAAEVTEEEFEKRLFTAGCPDPDLLIRTSGEQRISNFMLWQLAYTELFISPVLWPDFGRHQLFEAMVDYQARERRFGRVSA